MTYRRRQSFTAARKMFYSHWATTKMQAIVAAAWGLRARASHLNTRSIQ